MRQTMTQPDLAERGANVRFPPPTVYVAFILLGWGLSYAAALPVPGPRYMSLAAGVAILLAGFWLGAEAIKLFRRTGQEPAPWKPSPELMLSGPASQRPLSIPRVVLKYIDLH